MTAPDAQPDSDEARQTLRASPFVRACLAAYLFLVVYASWYPFSGWRLHNLQAFSEVIREWPRYWTLFDASVNVLGYLPLGALIVLALYPRVPRWWAALLAVVGSTLLSAGMESVQYFLPGRVTSLLDFITNSAGAAIGALLAAWCTPLIMQTGRLHVLRRHWVLPGSDRALLVLALWPLAQLYPQAYLFGLGAVVPLLSGWLSALLDADIDLAALVWQGYELQAQEYWLAETVITACGNCGALMLLLALLTREAPRLPLSGLLLLATLAAKTLASALLFYPEYAYSWFTPGARGGLLISFIMLYGFSYAPLRVQKRLALMMLALALLVLNLLPDNPYFSATLQTWVQGKFLNFNGAAQFLSLCWPFLALWVLLRKTPAEN